MAEYKLYYFSLRGRGQAMRYIFADKGIDYETINIGPEWRTKYKQTMPFGQAPLLQHGDFKIAQSNAILRYLGRQLDLYPTDVKEMAMVDMVSDHIEDIRLPYARMIYQDYENGKDDYIKTLPEKLGYLENLMKTWGNEFITSKITVVDYNLLDLLEILTVLSPTCLDAFTTLKGFVAKMQARPGISKYQNTQEFKDMPINGNGKQ